MARKKQPPIGTADKRTIGALLRELRRAAGYRSVDKAADVPACPASTATIYAYERGGLVPSLAQFLELAYDGLVLHLAMGRPRTDLGQVLDLVEAAVRRP